LDVLRLIEEQVFHLTRISDYKCNNMNCLKRGDASKNELIQLHPDVLMVHLKRFPAENWGMAERGKVHTRVSYPHQLNLDKFSCSAANSGHYKLKAVVLHEGPNAVEGHYKTVSQERGSWVLYNDTEVSC